MVIAVETAGLTRRFGASVAVDHLDLSIEQGSLFGLLGPNGAGKTTALKMLITLLTPSAGRARVAGFDVGRQASLVRGSIGYVPQLLSADGSLTGYENLLVSCRLHRVPRAQRRSRIDEALALTGLEQAAHRLVRVYSGGMIRRLEVVQAMLHRPPVLFLDEPTVGLDPVARRSVWDQLRRLRQHHATTMVLTTHYMEEAEELCDGLGIMHLGRLVALGDPQALKASVPGAVSLDDVFAACTGASMTRAGMEQEGGFRDVARTRRAVRRMA
ncbi:MAG: ABC transporter ATP-binding protein [Acidimicrobiales bacterium]